MNIVIYKKMGSQLSKKYDYEKEPYLYAGMHNLWKAYRGTMKTSPHQDVTIFMFEKKVKKGQTITPAAIEILKKDA